MAVTLSFSKPFFRKQTMNKQLKILFFIADAVPTAHDSFEASQIPAQVCFRNAAYIEDASESCDGVAGAVPECYSGFPKASVAIAKYQAELKARSAKLGDVAAPKKQPGAQKPEGNKTQQVPNPTNPPGNPPAWNPNPTNPPA